MGVLSPVDRAGPEGGVRLATPGVDPGGCDVGRRGSGAPAQKAVTPLCPLSFESLRVLLCPLKVQMSFLGDPKPTNTAFGLGRAERVSSGKDCSQSFPDS